MTPEPLYRVTFGYREADRGDDALYPGEGVVLDVSELQWKRPAEAPGYDHGET
jgi:hypothetical protein